MFDLLIGSLLISLGDREIKRGAVDRAYAAGFFLRGKFL